MYYRFVAWNIEVQRKICRFIALNLKAFIKFVALSDKMSRKKNHRIALTDKFSIIAAHHCTQTMDQLQKTMHNLVLQYITQSMQEQK